MCSAERAINLKSILNMGFLWAWCLPDERWCHQRRHLLRHRGQFYEKLNTDSALFIIIRSLQTKPHQHIRKLMQKRCERKRCCNRKTKKNVRIWICADRPSSILKDEQRKEIGINAQHTMANIYRVKGYFDFGHCQLPASCRHFWFHQIFATVNHLL